MACLDILGSRFKLSVNFINSVLDSVFRCPIALIVDPISGSIKQIKLGTPASLIVAL